MGSIETSKEYTDHRNGYRWYVDLNGSDVHIRIVTYPERETVMEFTIGFFEYERLLEYLSYTNKEEENNGN